MPVKFAHLFLFIFSSFRMTNTKLSHLVFCFILFAGCFSVNNQTALAQDASSNIETPKNADEFNDLFGKTIDSLGDLIQLGGYRPDEPNAEEIAALKQHIKALDALLAFKSDHWQSMLLKAKAYQRLGEHPAALEWLMKGMEVEPNNHILPKEASIEAVVMCDMEKALEFSAEAVNRKEGDPELLGNHAMNFLLAEKDEDARQTIKMAIEAAPDDAFNQRISRLIEDVIAGKKDRPTCDSIF